MKKYFRALYYTLNIYHFDKIVSLTLIENNACLQLILPEDN